MKLYKSINEIPIANFFLGLTKTGNLAYLRKDIEFYDIDETTEIPENALEVYYQIYSEIPNIDLTRIMLKFKIEKCKFKYLKTNKLNFKDEQKYYEALLKELEKEPEQSDIMKTITILETHFKIPIDIYKSPVIKLFHYIENLENEAKHTNKSTMAKEGML